jgi:hypothetical protein
MEQLTLTEKILITLAGYDLKNAAEITGHERGKMCKAGTMVLIPGFVALFSYGYAFYFIFNSLFSAVLGGIVSCIILILIDRTLMSWSRSQKFSFGLAGRLAFALVVGVLLAEPVVLAIFNDSIKEQQHKELVLQKIESDETYQSFEENIISQIKLEDNKIEALRLAYTTEMDGTGGSGIRNQGPIFKQKYQDYISAKEIYSIKIQNLNNDLAEIEKKKLVARNLVEINNADGLIGRMRALNELGQKENVVWWATWLTRLLFILIELLPFFIKLSPTGDNELYYKIQDMRDEERIAVLTALSSESVKVNETVARLQYKKQLMDLKIEELKLEANAKQEEAILLMKKASEMADIKLGLIRDNVLSTQDEKLKEKLLAQFELIVDAYLKSIDNLILQSFKTGNI